MEDEDIVNVNIENLGESKTSINGLLEKITTTLDSAKDVADSVSENFIEDSNIGKRLTEFAEKNAVEFKKVTDGIENLRDSAGVIVDSYIELEEDLENQAVQANDFEEISIN